MKPIVFDEARSAALDALARIRSSDSTRLAVLELLEPMAAAYQAKLGECSEAEIGQVRIAMEQIKRLRRGLTEPNIKAVGLFVP